MDENNNENEVVYGVDPVNPDNNGGQVNPNPTPTDAPLEPETVVNPGQEPAKEVNGMAIGSLVCGIISIISCCAGIAALIFGIVAIVLGAKSRKNSDGSNSGVALGGLICGIIGVVIGIFTILASMLLQAGFNAVGEYAEDAARDIDWSEFSPIAEVSGDTASEIDWEDFFREISESVDVNT